jgi:hypothetical protein
MPAPHTKWRLRDWVVVLELGDFACQRSSFSAEKEAKRLLSVSAGWLLSPRLNGQKFFGSFSQERTTLLCPSTRGSQKSP